VPRATTPCDQAERQFEQAAGDQRYREEQPDLGVVQMEAGAYERKRRALRPVGKFVSELDGEGDGERRGGGKAGGPAAGDRGYGSTSHADIVTEAWTSRTRRDRDERQGSRA
jgi:hypothetical protein